MVDRKCAPFADSSTGFPLTHADEQFLSKAMQSKKPRCGETPGPFRVRRRSRSVAGPDILQAPHPLGHGRMGREQTGDLMTRERVDDEQVGGTFGHLHRPVL